MDQWLWFARMFKSRSRATEFVAGGKVRRERYGRTEKLTKSGALVRPGDVLTFSIGPRVRVLKVRASGARRGPASQAALLYEDLSPDRNA